MMVHRKVDSCIYDDLLSFILTYEMTNKFFSPICDRIYVHSLFGKKVTISVTEDANAAN